MKETLVFIIGSGIIWDKKISYSVQSKFVNRNVERRKLEPAETEYQVQNINEKKRCETAILQNVLLKKFHISHGPVDKMLKSVNEVGVFVVPDKRELKTLANKMPYLMLHKAKDYIEVFPTVESQYRRKSSQRSYLDLSLSISKM